MEWWLFEGIPMPNGEISWSTHYDYARLELWADVRYKHSEPWYYSLAKEKEAAKPNILWK